MIDYIELSYSESNEWYIVTVYEYFDPFGNSCFLDTYEEAMEWAMKLAEYHKVEIRVVDGDGKLKEIIANGLL